MKIKKIALLFCFIAVFVSVQAQTEKPLFGFTAGATFASFKFKSQDVSATSKMKVGFSAGFLSSFSISPGFKFEPELDFIQKGGVYNDASENTTNKTTCYYLELPLNFVYNIHSSGGNFFVGAGPTFGLGLSGKYKITGIVEESGDIKFGSGSNDDLKQFETGLNFLAGFKFKKGFLITANYDFGLNNISPESDATYHNRCFAIKLGYLFGK